MGIVLRNLCPRDGNGRVSLRIEDGRIDRLAKEDLSPAVGDQVIDASGRLAIPGFVNAHTHLAMVLLRGQAEDVPLRTWLEDYVWPIESTLTPEDVYWCTLHALVESIRSGTVAVADMYFHTDAVARAVEQSGIRALLSYGMVAPSLDEGGREELLAAEATVMKWHGAGNGRIQVAVSPHTVYTCGEDVLRRAGQLAGQLGVPIHTHVSESREEVASCISRVGMTPPAYLERLGVLDVPTLAAHCVHVNEEDLAILKRHDVHVAHCPKSNAKLGNGVAPIVRMRELGIPVALGTDGVASNNRLDMIEELRAAWLVERAVSEEPARLLAQDAVAMATVSGREALRLPRADLQPGDVADFVLLDVSGLHALPPQPADAFLAFAAQSSDVTDVFVAGRPLMRNRELLTIDEERVQSEVLRLHRSRSQ
jgi:5-methylthioadenosine/S-adenosylhomocysteine deaminase